MDLQQHQQLKSKFLSERESAKKQTVEDVQKWLDSFAYRYYFMEKTLGSRVFPSTKFARVLAFERMVQIDPSFTRKDE